MRHADFLHAVQRERAAWDALLAQVEEGDMTRPGVADEWSLQDLIAHLTWYEREMVGVLEARALVGSDLWNQPLAERNATIYEANRHRDLDDVQAEAAQVFPRLEALLRELTDEDLTDASRFREMPAEWVPWEVIASNTFEHYQAHLPDLRAWLQRVKAEA